MNAALRRRLERADDHHGRIAVLLTPTGSAGEPSNARPTTLEASFRAHTPAPADASNRGAANNSIQQLFPRGANLMRKTTLRVLPLGIILALTWVASASAGTIVISLSEDGGLATQVLSASSGTTLTLSGPYAAAPDFSFTGFTVTSNADLTSGVQGELMGTGGILPAGTGTHTLTILVSDNGFTFPAGPDYFTHSSSSFTAVNIATSADTFEFQSYSTPGQQLFGTAVPNPRDTYSPLAASGSGPTSTVVFTSTTGYTLTQRYEWTSTGSTALFQATGSTITQLVPEPASWVMALVGIVGSLGLAMGQRAVRATA
jgi:hypothetical protein